MAKITSSSEGGDSAPVLSASALSKLSEKINAGVQSSKTEKKKPKARKEKKLATTTNVPVKAQEPPKANVVSKPVKTTIPVNTKFTKPDNSHKHEASRGKKRDRNGSVKSGGAKLVITGTNNTVLQPRKTPKKKALLEEILALGGTEEDFALIEDLDSNSDEEETVIVEKSKGKAANKQEIEDFMKEIGLGKTEAAIVEDDEVEEDNEGDDEGDVEADDESEEDVKTKAKAQAPPKVSTSASKDMGPKSKHLVSTIMSSCVVNPNNIRFWNLAPTGMRTIYNPFQLALKVLDLHNISPCSNVRKSYLPKKIHHIQPIICPKVQTVNSCHKL